MATAEQIAKKMQNEMVESIEKQITTIDKHLRKYDALIEQRKRLHNARRAFLSDRSPTQGGGRGLTQEEVVNALRGTDAGTGYTVSDLAKKLGNDPNTIRAALNRGKDERFRVEDVNGQKIWFLREPEEDEEEDDDE